MNIYLKIFIIILITATAITPTVYFVGIDGIGVWLSGLGASAFIAVIALGFAIWQGWQNQKHNKLSLCPLLGSNLLDSRSGNKRHIKFELVNNGVGPVIIESVILFFEGKEKLRDSAKEYNEFFNKNLKNFDNRNLGFLVPDSIMKTTEEQVIWDVKYNLGTDNVDFIKKLDLRVEYKSIYGDKMPAYDTREDIKFIEYKSMITTPSPSLIAQKFAHIHAACFTIPRPWTAEEFVSLLKIPNVVYIEHEYGLAIGGWLDTEQTELSSLAVIPHEQSKGIGDALLKKFIATIKANGGKSIFLEVAENNAPALHLYEKAGFKKVGLRTSYYEVPNAPNIDAILMRLDIETP